MKDKLGLILLDWRVKTVLPHISGNYLDVGCGTNEIVKSYSGKGTGVDVYPWDGADLVVEDTAKLPFDDKSFDTVSIIAALNHIPNREDVIKEIKRILRDDGKLIITMIPPRFSRVWHFFRKPWDADQHERGMKAGEVFGLTTKEIKKILSKAELEVVYQKKFMMGLNHLLIAKKRNSISN